jgi:hypothetical protein
MVIDYISVWFAPLEPFARCIVFRESQIVYLRFGIAMFVLDGSLRVDEQNFDVNTIQVRWLPGLRRQDELPVGGFRQFM